jgi:uncharacterized flavoprotein (TIGR03862 family)
MKQVVIVGAGPAGLMAATRLQQSGRFHVLVVDHKKTVGRKFLVAGEGGLNLTHSEALDSFVEKYSHEYLKKAVRCFTPYDFRSFLAEIGIPTYVGSSGKIFPEEGIKPIEVLNAWIHSLHSIRFQKEASLVDFDRDTLDICVKGGELIKLKYDYAIFALGGASWKRTGSDGKWLDLFLKNHIAVKPFQSSNSGVELKPDLLPAVPGDILKNCTVRVSQTKVSGDVVFTNYGLEGKPIYAVNRALRESGANCIFIDLKPQLTEVQLIEKLKCFKTSTEGLKSLKIPKQGILWLKQILSKSEYTELNLLANTIKNLPIPILGFRPLDEVISVVGGVPLGELLENGQLKKYPKVFLAGEMLDWDAPTGGYLIQGAVSTGWLAAQQIIDRSEED